MKRTITSALAGLALGAAILTGCGGDPAADLKKDLEAEGFDSETADCIVKGLQAENVDLVQYGELSAEDTAKLEKVTTDCMGLGDLGDLGDVSIPE